MTQQQANAKAAQECDYQYEDERDYYDDDFLDYDDFQAMGGGGGGAGSRAAGKKTTKRQNQRGGGGSGTIYSAKHIRAKEAQMSRPSKK